MPNGRRKSTQPASLIAGYIHGWRASCRPYLLRERRKFIQCNSTLSGIPRPLLQQRSDSALLLPPARFDHAGQAEWCRREEEVPGAVPYAAFLLRCLGWDARLFASLVRDEREENAYGEKRTANQPLNFRIRALYRDRAGRCIARAAFGRHARCFVLSLLRL